MFVNIAVFIKMGNEDERKYDEWNFSKFVAFAREFGWLSRETKPLIFYDLQFRPQIAL